MKDRLENAVREAFRIETDQAERGIKPTFGPLVSTCARYGIKRGMAFLLARQKRIQVFSLNRKTFVVIASIEALAKEGDE